LQKTLGEKRKSSREAKRVSLRYCKNERSGGEPPGRKEDMVQVKRVHAGTGWKKKKSPELSRGTGENLTGRERGVCKEHLEKNAAKSPREPLGTKLNVRGGKGGGTDQGATVPPRIIRKIKPMTYLKGDISSGGKSRSEKKTRGLCRG